MRVWLDYSSTMEYSYQQLQALEAVAAWRQSDRQVFRLFGYAGSGKTTLAKVFAEGESNARFASFTGKAALVLRRKGCANATTIHSLIYNPSDKDSSPLRTLRDRYAKLLERVPPTPEDEAQASGLLLEIHKEEKRMKQPGFSLNPDSAIREASIVIIDEVSMVGKRLAEDLLSFGRKTLVLGDPAQLPPVADGGYFTNVEPDFMLDQIHRQAADSPIIQLASRVRLGESIDYGEYRDSRVCRKGAYSVSDILDNHDMILCGTNKMRRNINAKARREYYSRTSPFPEVGDRLVCLRNNHDLGLLNGSLWNVEETHEVDDKLLFLDLKSDDTEDKVECAAHKATFLGEELSYFERREAEEFDYGYCLTTHKAQGSQWGRVYVVDESSVFRGNSIARDMANRWLYTAITRAAESVTVAR